MTIVIRYDDDGKPITRTLGGVGSDSDREKAYELDELLKTEMKKLKRKLDKISTERDKVEAYWELGTILKKIFYDSELVKKEEKNLFLLNAKLHTPIELQVKDRGPNRIHLEYCFRLANYPKKIALKRKWSEWVYLYDSPSINKDSRFDKWDENHIQKTPDYLSRENTRLFIQFLNSVLKNIETLDLTDEELKRCYDGTWILTKKVLNDFKEELHEKEFKISMKEKIIANQHFVGDLMENKITPDDFAGKITS